MAQLTIYLPDDVEKDLRRRARVAKKSLSAYVVDLARGPKRKSGWPKNFAKLAGSWEGEFPIPDDPPPDEPEEL